MAKSIIAFWRLAVVLFCTAISVPLYAQAISVNPDTLEASVRAQVINTNRFYINGPITQGLSAVTANQHYRLGPMSRSVLTLTALRMLAAGRLDLDENIARTLPDLLPENPFRVAVTPRHILTETAGFAVPPRTDGLVTLDHYLTQVRTAGKIAHADSVGWSLLAVFLEAKGADTLENLINKHLLNPLGLASGSLKLGTGASALSRLQDMTGNGALIAEISRLTVRNRDKNGTRFLPKDIYAQFTQKQSWRMHPVGPRRLLGSALTDVGKRSYIHPPTEPISANFNKAPLGASFVTFPKQGISFVTLNGIDPDFLHAIEAIADQSFLPAQPDNRIAQAQGLSDRNIRFNGNYVRSDAPSAWLAHRLKTLASERLTLSDTSDGTLYLEFTNGERLTFQKRAPYLFDSLGGERVILSPYRQGGYLVLDGTLYRFIGILGNTEFVLDLMPVVMLILLSSAVYLGSNVSPRWRRMALFGTLGTLMVAGGIAADYYLWPKAVFIWDSSWLVILWRIMLNTGLALVLSLPLFAISFTRKNEMPQGAAIFIAPLHLALISVSALVLFLILVAWGVAGEFSAY